MVNEQVNQRMLSLLEGMASLTARQAEELLKLFLEKRDKEKEIKAFEKGKGEVPLRNMLDNIKQGDSLNTVVIPDEDYNRMKELLQVSGIKNFAFADLVKDDAKMLLFNTSETDCVRKTIEAYKAERGLINEFNIDSFLMLAQDHSVSAIDNISPVELELLRYNTRKEPLPYAIVSEGETFTIAYYNKDTDNLKKILNNVSAALTGPNSDMIREQVEYRIKGKKEIGIAFEEAKKEAFIVDKMNPSNYLQLTAEDITYYKNNKEITRIPRTEPGATEAAYQKLEGLTEPVVLTKNEFELSPAEKKAVLNSKTSFYPTESKIEEDIEKLNLDQVQENAASKSYAEKFNVYAIDNQPESLDDIISQIKQTQEVPEKENQPDRAHDSMQYGR